MTTNIIVKRYLVKAAGMKNEDYNMSRFSSLMLKNFTKEKVNHKM